MAYLRIVSERGDSSKLELLEQVVRAGRSSANDLVLADPAASREHFELRRSGTVYVLSDLKSRNGTLLNGMLISNEVRLRAGDEIQVGRTRLYYLHEERSRDISSLPIAGSPTLMFRADQLADSLRQEEHTTPGASPGAAVVLSQLATELMSVTEEMQLLELICGQVRTVLQADRCAVVYRGPTDEDIEIKSVSCADSQQSRELTISSTAVQQVLEERMALQISNVQCDDRYMHQQSIMLQRIGSILCAPLWHEETVFGLVYVDTTGRAGGYGKRHLALLSAIANLTAIKIDNLRLFEQAVAKARMEQELSLAADIQSAMLPRSPYPFAGLECVGFNRPCYEVGGDYFDFIPASDSSSVLTVTVADVSGKGASAAMLMASCKSMLTALIETGVPLLERMERLNRYVTDNSTPNRFVTCFHGELDTQNNLLTYCNAGHNPPILLLPGREPCQLDATAMVLGVLEYPMDTEQIPFPNGAVLFAYSDGVIYNNICNYRNFIAIDGDVTIIYREF